MGMVEEAIGQEDTTINLETADPMDTMAVLTTMMSNGMTTILPMKDSIQEMRKRLMSNTFIDFTGMDIKPTTNQHGTKSQATHGKAKERAL